MATLEDKILGEKLHNYCSSSEESDGDDEDNSDTDEPKQPKQSAEDRPQLPEPNKWEGSSTNTGPKGVIKDWQRFKQLETEKRREDEQERIDLIKKLSITVKSVLDEEAEKQAAEEDPEFAELLDDEFLLNYQKQRMQELMLQNKHKLKFGKLVQLGDGQQYLDAVDKEHKAVLVIIHLYESHVVACRTMNECLAHLCRVYEEVKFCAIIASQAGLSNSFKAKGVPALLVYRGGQLIGNFVRISDDLGQDFCAEDLQGYLVEHGMLEDKSLTPLIIRGNDIDSD